MKLVTRISTALVAATVLFAAPASAQLIPGSGWQQFSFGGVGPAYSPWDTFSFNPTQWTVVKLTDGFCYGDTFTLSWTGTTSGSFDTSAPGSSSCDGPTDGEAAFADPNMSSGSAIFQAGSYTFSLDVTASPFGGGGAFITAESTVPEPATMTLLATGLAGIAASRRRRKLS